MKKLLNILKKWCDLSHDQPWKKHENINEKTKTSS